MYNSIDELFQSTRPMRGATAQNLAYTLADYVSIHAPRTGRDIPVPETQRQDHVSIHAPRAGRDHRRAMVYARQPSFNPRAPCGARLAGGYGVFSVEAFQSTRPVRGATFPSGTLRLHA